ncbi:MAG: GyrI-like domain-containing protein [Candidatus Cloacimonetes bacterium]|nr:GyrI-like domain-containing protein [Candidatus Cloacimonadota bacterium]
MELKFIKQYRLVLAGFNYYGDPFSISAEWTEENEIGRLWNRFMSWFEQHRETVEQFSTPGVAYEMHLYGNEANEKGYFDIFTGFSVRNIEEVPFELLIRYLPESDYAILTVSGDEITMDWSEIIKTDLLP